METACKVTTLGYHLAGCVAWTINKLKGEGIAQ